MNAAAESPLSAHPLWKTQCTGMGVAHDIALDSPTAIGIMMLVLGAELGDLQLLRGHYGWALTVPPYGGRTAERTYIDLDLGRVLSGALLDVYAGRATA